MYDEIEFIQLVDNDVDDNKRSEIICLIDNLFKSTADADDATNDFSSSAIEERRVRLVDWLKRNHIPAADDDNDVIEILDSVTIRRPFGVSDCQSTNEIILDKIRNLVKLFDSQR